jgi:Xaa-Pro aminopeptidase
MTSHAQYDYPGRLARLRKKMAERGLDGVYVAAGPNMRYLAGWSAYDGGWPIWLSALVVPREGNPVFLLSKMHRDILAVSGSWLRDGDVRIHRDGDKPKEHLAAVLKELRMAGGRLGVEDNLWNAEADFIREAAPGTRLESASAALDGLRMIKDAAEIEAIRKANDIVSIGYERAAEVIRPGVAEYDVAMAIMQAMVAAGSESMGVGGWFRQLTQRKIERGDVVDVDMGARWDGYNTDTARNVFVGPPTKEHERAYQATLDAFNRTLEMIKPGVPLQDIHRFSAGSMKKQGFDQVWKIGHGVGLRSGHEWPMVQDGETMPAEVGMVFTVDPGCFITGQVRDTPIHIEDVVVVTPTGCENLTRFRRDLIVV